MRIGAPAVRVRSYAAALQARLDEGYTAWTVRLAALTFMAFSSLDCVTTAYALSHGEREENPFVGAVYRDGGAGSLWVSRAAVVAVVLIGMRLLPRRLAAWAGVAATAFTAAIVVANVLTIGR